jgi:GntR family transcriptional regulator/MocR family aminotransferase
MFRGIAAGAGLRVTGVPVDRDGIRVSGIRSPAVVITPAHQFPMGVTLSSQRRDELVRWAGAHGGLVIEDDYDGEFRFDRRQFGALQALAPDRVVYAGTASKTLAPGMRLAWLVLPRSLVDPVRTQMVRTGWRPPALDQLVFAELLESGAYDKHVRSRRAEYRDRRRRLEEAALPHLAITEQAAGLHVLAMLPPGGPGEAEVIEAAERQSLRLGALGEHWISAGPHPPGLLIGYATPAKHAFGPALEALRVSLGVLDAN